MLDTAPQQITDIEAEVRQLIDQGTAAETQGQTNAEPFYREAGAKLIPIKKAMKKNRGAWEAYCRDQIGISKTTANVYIRIAKVTEVFGGYMFVYRLKSWALCAAAARTRSQEAGC